eukprot:Lithocolla_globosa_v1_NODE_2364_length_2027_cov_77.436805.p3 type:complete len:111 gc:universal NODE_2364_length_2027_cov_77.436805:1496-1164(-)
MPLRKTIKKHPLLLITTNTFSSSTMFPGPKNLYRSTRTTTPPSTVSSKSSFTVLAVHMKMVNVQTNLWFFTRTNQLLLLTPTAYHGNGVTPLGREDGTNIYMSRTQRSTG